MELNVDILEFIKEGKEWSRASVEEKCNLTLLKMLEEAVHADITIKVAGGGAIKAHRSVLASISPVFQAMFEHKMKEQLTSTVELPEISIPGLKLFLVLVYILPDNTAAPEEFKVSVALHFDELLDACCKFQVQRLEPTITENLNFQLSPDNCWDYLRKSHTIFTFCIFKKRTNPCDLCFYYICRNFSKVLESSSFIVEMRTDPMLVQKLLRMLVGFKYDGTVSKLESFGRNVIVGKARVLR